MRIKIFQLKTVITFFFILSCVVVKAQRNRPRCNIEGAVIMYSQYDTVVPDETYKTRSSRYVYVKAPGHVPKFEIMDGEYSNILMEDITIKLNEAPKRVDNLNFAVSQVRIDIGDGAMLLRSFKKLGDMRSKKVDKSDYTSAEPLTVESASNLESGLYSFLLEQQYIDSVIPFFYDRSNMLDLTVEISKAKIHSLVTGLYFSLSLEGVFKVTDYSGKEIFTQAFNKEGEILPVRFYLQNSYYLSSYEVSNGSKGAFLWNHTLERAFLDMYSSSEFLSFIENRKNAFQEKDRLPVVRVSKPLKSATNASDALKSIVTVEGEKGHGSGCVISDDGYIVTNYHVLGGNPDSLHVVSHDGKKFKVKVERVDEIFDLALLKIQETSSLKGVSLTESPSPKLGDFAYVIGTPADTFLGQTVTRGIFSAIRDVDGKRIYQTDAVVNPGNSGGGLFNANFNLVGIVASKGIGNVVEGLGFAIPTNYVFQRLRITY